jgi:16S rRNA (guanine527-N7)-methyltransferase
MTEAEARVWIARRFGVSRETALDRLIALVIDENSRQNLIAPNSVDVAWSRHVADSAQLLDHVGGSYGAWLDIGTGAGFPGLVVAALRDTPITLCEPRKRRAAFLERAVDDLGLTGHVSVIASRAEAMTGRYAIISARAVARLEDLFAAAHHLATPDTVWLLPKGRGANEEVAEAQATWHGSFHVEPSLTEPGSLIVVARGIARK